MKLNYRFWAVLSRFVNANANEREQKDKNDLFGTTIFSQLKQLPHQERVIAKHQIRNVMFQIQMSKINSLNTGIANSKFSCSNTDIFKSFNIDNATARCSTSSKHNYMESI